MHIVLQNTTHGSDKTYAITTGTGRLECHHGKTGGPQRLGTNLLGTGSEIDAEVERLLREKRRKEYRELSRRNLSLDWLAKDQVTATIRPECVDRFRVVGEMRRGEPLSVGEYQLHYSKSSDVVEIRWVHGKDSAGTSLWGVLESSTMLTGPAGSAAATVALALWKAGLADIVAYPDFALGTTWNSATPTARTFDNEVDALFLPGDIVKALGSASVDPDFKSVVDTLSSARSHSPVAELFASVGVWKGMGARATLL